jgi:hypothetical protein
MLRKVTKPSLAKVSSDASPSKARHDRLCWLTQKRVEKRAYKQRSKARETESMSLVTRTPMVLEIDRRA